MAKSIMVYGEISEGNLTSLTQEVLSIGRRLSDDLGSPLTALFIGEGLDETAREAIYLGADKVHVADDPALKEYQVELYLKVMEGLLKELEPEILLIGHNFSGSDLAARIAFRLGAGLTMDCIDLAVDPETKRLLQKKPIYGGNVIAEFSTESDLQVATLRNKAFSISKPNSSREGEITTFHPHLDVSTQKIKRIEKVVEDLSGIRLEDAEVVVCGGRGMGSQEAFSQLEELAGMLGGAVGGTRPTCEKGWAHPRLQVGLTGEKVAPKLYIGVGVSGAVQHMVGIAGSKKIVAINRDPEANILREAHYGVVGDYGEILPSFKAKIREYLESR